jgi:serine/arginine repetitive matrix protein 2
MHVEAVSEGERSQLDRQDEVADAQLSDDSPMMSEAQGRDDTRQKRVEPKPEVDTEHSETKADDPKTEEEPIISPPATPLLPDDTPTKSRRRSRSRSRGRGSKDFKGKAKTIQPPSSTNAVSANDSSPDEGPVASTSQPSGFTSPPLMSPIPAHFALIQAQRIFASPEPGMVYPGTSPPTPMLPTLQDIQRGLFRSNSAAARLMVLQQLAGPGGYDPSLASPPVTPPPLSRKIFRNNTVGGGGGERIAARKVMMRQLGKRLKEAEAEHTSGGEEPQPATPARRKRRSKRRSLSRSPVDDREPPLLVSVTTPVLQTPALPSPTPETVPDEPDTHPVLPERSPTPNARSPSVERSREDALAKLTGESPSAATYGYETALERRGPVVEEEDDAPDHDHGQASPVPRSTYNGRSETPPQIPSPRPPHAPGALSGTSAESADGGVSAYTPNTAQEQQRVFATSPFATPLRERQGPDEEEEDSHTENDTARRSPWNDAYDREISWVAELGQFLEYDASPLWLNAMPTLVPERIPVHDDNDYDDADDTDEPRDHPSAPQHPSDPEEHEHEDDDESLPRASTQGLVVDIETSPEASKASHIPPSPSSAIVLHRHFSDDSRIFPARLSISSPSQPELSSPNTEYQEWEESLRVIVTDSTPKKGGENSQSRWDKVKNAFARPGSSNGRRSRTNSIRERANNTDSSTSRESGASLTGASKTDKGTCKGLSLYAHWSDSIEYC